MLRSEIIRRRNNSNFPLLVDISGQLKEDRLDVDVRAFEELLDIFFGRKLSDIPRGGGDKQLDACKNFIKNYSNDYLDEDLFLQLSRNFFGESLVPSAMLYEDTIEMKKNIFLMYQLSYSHYILGKHYNMGGRFPKYCCGRSSRNLLTAFWEAGIVSAVMVYNNWHDHAYIIVPFVIKKANVKGVILVDPTSDQLMNDPCKKIRNNIMILTDKDWSYVTDWADGNDLHPRRVEISACYGFQYEDYDEYVERALACPAVVV